MFETLAALAYAWMLRGRWPDALTLTGAALLVIGVGWAVRPSESQPNKASMSMESH